MGNRFKRIELIANLAIIVVAIVLLVALLSRYYAKPNLAAPVAEAALLKAGTKLPVSNVDWSRNERNLILVLSTACHFCQESAPFYQRLTQKNLTEKKLRTIAILPQEADAARQYMAEKNIILDEVLKGNPGDLMVRGTPTLILLDKDGVVLDTWVGKLSAEKEEEVMTKVFADITHERPN